MAHPGELLSNGLLSFQPATSGPEALDLSFFGHLQLDCGVQRPNPLQQNAGNDHPMSELDALFPTGAPLSITNLLMNLAVGVVLAALLRWHFIRFASTLSNRGEFAPAISIFLAGARWPLAGVAQGLEAAGSLRVDLADPGFARRLELRPLPRQLLLGSAHE